MVSSRSFVDNPRDNGTLRAAAVARSVLSSADGISLMLLFSSQSLDRARLGHFRLFCQFHPSSQYGIRPPRLRPSLQQSAWGRCGCRRRIDFQNPSFYKPAHARAIRPGAVSIAPKPAGQSSCYRVTESRRAAPRGIKTNEAYLPTVQTRPQTPARFPCPHGHQGWSWRRRSPPQPRSQAAQRLNGRRDRCPPPASQWEHIPSGF